MSKRGNEEGQATRRNVKKTRLNSARFIRSETSDLSFKDGVLDVPSFVNSRKFEIEQLEKAHLKSKNAKSTRVFQALPRSLRRRAASHNVKRIPKRLRNKALREMLRSNEAEETAKRKKKVKRKSAKYFYHIALRRSLLKVAANLNALKLLPSEVVNRRLNLRNMIKMLRKQSKTKEGRPLNNSYGSYDNTGIGKWAPTLRQKIRYAKRQQQYKWISTHIWHAKRFHFIKRWGWNIPYKPTQKLFRVTHRAGTRTGTVAVDTSYEGTIVIDYRESSEGVEEFLAPLVGKPAIKSTILNGKEFYHGEFYCDFQGQGNWEVLSKGVMYMNNANKKVLLAFHPADFEDFWQYLETSLKTPIVLHDCRYALGSINLAGPKLIEALVSVLAAEKRCEYKKLVHFADVGSIGSNSVFTMNVRDPRFSKKPRTPRPSLLEDDALKFLISLKQGRYVDSHIVNDLLSPEGREKSYEHQLTIRQINEKRSRLQNPFKTTIPFDSEDYRIPLVILFGGKDGFTKVIAPWFWISPIWQSLVKVPRVYPGGMLQLAQIAFENGTKYYPDDYPYIKPGAVENELTGIHGKGVWGKKPKGKRVNYKQIVIHRNDYELYKQRGELGDPFKCDWRFLQLLQIMKKIRDYIGEGDNTVDLLSSDFLKKPFSTKDILHYIHNIQKSESLKDAQKNWIVNSSNPALDLAVFEQSIQSFLKGEAPLSKLLETRLPVQNVSLKLEKGGKIKTNARIYTDENGFMSLVGFVTTGSFNLAQGKYSGVGAVVSGVEGEVYIRCSGSDHLSKGFVSTM